ncbi:response regulator transcription factor [Lapidilactobacillus bayanensis]|uniref:response regulator transcription factor n=1 Tax=Lapidilactobacillus bayanensis TaxID=2485998 RepID=UPI000F79485D|nr:response regulator transcription factor [Lapidilactobacillus bayanensis]
MNLLIVEDNQILLESMQQFFCHHFQVTGCRTLAEVNARLQKQSFDAIILDLSLPDGNGLIWLKQWQPFLTAKLLILTANDQEDAMISGLSLAADYVVKPTSLNVLQLRLQKLLPTAPQRLGDLEVDLSQRRVRRQGQIIPLTAIEWRLVAFFTANQEQLLSREQLLKVIWDAQDNFVSDNTLTVTIKRLREKLEHNPSQPQLIQTIRGMGYFIHGEN